MSRETVGVILAGGKSRRMGMDKAFLEIGGIPLIERAVKALLPIFSTVAIVAKAPQKFYDIRGTHFVSDIFSEQHALGGIYTALSYFSGKDCFVFACDMPFLNPHLIRAMMASHNGYDLFIPRSRHGLEMLHAIYTERCRGVIEEKLRKREWCLEYVVRKLKCGIFDTTHIHTFDPGELSFLNINTREALKKAQALA